MNQLAAHPSDAYSRLSDLTLFSHCSRRELRRVCHLGTGVRVRAGRQLMVEGDRGSEVMIVVSGLASCLVAGTEVATFGAGDFFGEVAALDGGRRTATVVARNEMELLVLERREFNQLLADAPSVAHRMVEKMALRLRRANDIGQGLPTAPPRPSHRPPSAKEVVTPFRRSDSVRPTASG